jgi:hypothetical protein
MSCPSHSPPMENCSDSEAESEERCLHKFKLDRSDDNPFGWLECTYCGQQQDVPRNTTKEAYSWMRRKQALLSMFPL